MKKILILIIKFILWVLGVFLALILSFYFTKDTAENLWSWFTSQLNSLSWTLMVIILTLIIYITIQRIIDNKKNDISTKIDNLNPNIIEKDSKIKYPEELSSYTEQQVKEKAELFLEKLKNFQHWEIKIMRLYDEIKNSSNLDEIFGFDFLSLFENMDLIIFDDKTFNKGVYNWTPLGREIYKRIYNKELFAIIVNKHEQLL